jgi:nitric oxide reductase activation protein
MSFPDLNYRMSYSTDAWMQSCRVLDIATESVLVLGEVLARWRDRVGIAGFYRHIRRDCRFVLLKRFDEPWPRCRAALASLEPIGYTRIGPTLRHSTALLERQPAAKKLCCSSATVSPSTATVSPSTTIATKAATVLPITHLVRSLTDIYRRLSHCGRYQPPDWRSGRAVPQELA